MFFKNKKTKSNENPLVSWLIVSAVWHKLFQKGFSAKLAVFLFQYVRRARADFRQGADTALMFAEIQLFRNLCGFYGCFVLCVRMK